MANPTGYEISEDLEEGTESGLDLFTSAGIPQEKKGFSSIMLNIKFLLRVINLIQKTAQKIEYHVFSVFMKIIAAGKAKSFCKGLFAASGSQGHC